ncbi:tRNA (guanosine(37)-N1)-methyltransferase TrmD [Agaribacterium haliotis]|uniref:tRNA (guanosine(37)-N1)-methyltransferase TrmD n=1 Tax=Agaribacterium haliotis TaxID=2013869 RepID=UPI000BB58239|nr:tRNA (guanosine(37)-N1)-methyltransferase TrmD [Agaribacterium haliotis]
MTDLARSQRLEVVVVSLFPEMFEALSAWGISSRAISDGLLSLHCINPRSFTEDKHQTVDDRPYGGGPGMVMKTLPLIKAVEAALEHLQCSREQAHVVYMSPQGRQLDTAAVGELKLRTKLVVICGRYEGVDERFIERYVDEEWSIGDYVLSGGELPAMVMLDALIRKLPGALGDQQSAEQDSFEAGLLDCPHYTRPEEILGQRVPEVLLSGDHKRIRQWRLQQSLVRTMQRRPELLDALQLSAEQEALLEAWKRNTKI